MTPITAGAFVAGVLEVGLNDPEHTLISCHAEPYGNLVAYIARKDTGKTYKVRAMITMVRPVEKAEVANGAG